MLAESGYIWKVFDRLRFFFVANCSDSRKINLMSEISRVREVSLLPKFILRTTKNKFSVHIQSEWDLPRNSRHTNGTVSCYFCSTHEAWVRIRKPGHTSIHWISLMAYFISQTQISCSSWALEFGSLLFLVEC